MVTRIIARHAALVRRGGPGAGERDRVVFSAQVLVEKLSTEVGRAPTPISKGVIALDDKHPILEVGGDLRLHEPELVRGREAADLPRAEAGNEWQGRLPAPANWRGV